jgi:hypothetical protein
MTILTHRQAPPKATSSSNEVAAERVLLLRATGEGWALIGVRGDVVFRAYGQTGRQACLAFARDHGVLALIR